MRRKSRHSTSKSPGNIENSSRDASRRNQNAPTRTPLSLLTQYGRRYLERGQELRYLHQPPPIATSRATPPTQTSNKTISIHPRRYRRRRRPTIPCNRRSIFRMARRDIVRRQEHNSQPPRQQLPAVIRHHGSARRILVR